MNIKPYPEYKNSGVAWLGQVPEGWEMRKTKYTFNERVQKGFPTEPLLAATQTKGVVPKTHYENRTVVAQKDLHLLKLVKKGDFVISLRSFQGGIELAHYQGIISPAYTIMIPNQEVLTGYFKHLAKSTVFIKLLTTCVTGIREGQNIDYEILKRSYLPIPTPLEQTTIAKFLDYKTAQIARFIKVKKRMIELLKEQKQVIINDAVTGKIDVATGKPYPKYKDSGVEWLGQMPEGWEVRRIKQIGFFNPSKSETMFSSKSPENVVFLPMENVSVDGKINCSIKRPYKDICNGFSYFRKGDVVVAKITPCFENGKGAYLNELETECGFGTTEFITIRPNSKIDGRLLRFILSSNWFLKIGEKYMTGSAGQKRISSDFIKNFYLGIPPLPVQHQIVSHIETKTTALDLTISRTEREIGLMQEYRTRLISDVVTGKIDVRDIAVPDMANIDDIIDEPLDESEGEGESETAEEEE